MLTARPQSIGVPAGGHQPRPPAANDAPPHAADESGTIFLNGHLGDATSATSSGVPSVVAMRAAGGRGEAGGRGGGAGAQPLFEVCMAKDEVKARLAPIPVFTVANPKNEFVLVAGEVRCRRVGGLRLGQGVKPQARPEERGACLSADGG